MEWQNNEIFLATKILLHFCSTCYNCGAFNLEKLIFIFYFLFWFISIVIIIFINIVEVLILSLLLISLQKKHTQILSSNTDTTTRKSDSWNMELNYATAHFGKIKTLILLLITIFAQNLAIYIIFFIFQNVI